MPRQSAALSRPVLKRKVLELLNANEGQGGWRVHTWGNGEIRLVPRVRHRVDVVAEGKAAKEETIKLCAVRAIMSCPSMLMGDTLRYDVPWDIWKRRQPVVESLNALVAPVVQLAWRGLTATDSIRPMIASTTTGAYHVWQDKLGIMLDTTFGTANWCPRRVRLLVAPWSMGRLYAPPQCNLVQACC